MENNNNNSTSSIAEMAMNQQFLENKSMKQDIENFRMQIMALGNALQEARTQQEGHKLAIAQLQAENKGLKSAAAVSDSRKKRAVDYDLHSPDFSMVYVGETKPSKMEMESPPSQTKAVARKEDHLNVDTVLVSAVCKDLEDFGMAQLAKQRDEKQLHATQAEWSAFTTTMALNYERLGQFEKSRQLLEMQERLKEVAKEYGWPTAKRALSMVASGHKYKNFSEVIIEAHKLEEIHRKETGKKSYPSSRGNNTGRGRGGKRRGNRGRGRGGKKDTAAKPSPPSK